MNTMFWHNFKNGNTLHLNEYLVLHKDGLSLKIKRLHNHLYFIATQYLKLCTCGIYRQLNSILYPTNHILKSSKIIFNVLVLRDFLVLAGNLKVGKPRLHCFVLETQHRILH